MPLYEYQCKQCGHRFEKIQSFSAPEEKECPVCKGEVERLISAPALQFKGSGWYVNDYAGKGGAKAAGKSESGTGGKDRAPAGETSKSTSSDATGSTSSGSSGSSSGSGSSGTSSSGTSSSSSTK